MILKKDKDLSPEATSKNKDNVDELKRFVQKKKNQNVALKKIIANLITDKNHLNNE